MHFDFRCEVAGEIKPEPRAPAAAGEKHYVDVRIEQEQVQLAGGVFVGVISPIDPRIDTPQEVCDRVLEAAEYVPVAQLGTCDDCGFAPFCDATRETAFAKIRGRVLGTALASERLQAS